MSTTEQVLNEVSTFFEDTTGKMNTTKRGYVEGDFLGHISNPSTIVRPVKNRFQARIYNFDVIVADEHAKMRHQYEDIDGKHVEISGEQFVGKKLIARGVFKFLDPQDGDTFEGNPTDNGRYLEFCEILGLTPKEETRTIDGKETRVKLLPQLTEEQMLGRPVTAFLTKVKDNWVSKKGEKMDYSWRVVKVKPWTSGKVRVMEVNTDDLPF
jgi:hypothetical protein